MTPSKGLRTLCAGAALGAGALLAGCGGEREPLLVFAAASLADALEEAGAAWEEGHPDTPVAFNFNSSNDLARQIAAGAPAGLFLSADRERLVAAGRADLTAAVALLGNELVVVAPAGSGTSVAGARGLLAFDRLGLADPEAVPAGVYARDWLEAEGVWDELSDRVVPALDVRANLAAVASGSVPAGVVYATDAGTSDRV
ncbi:MAG TPA: molybdate ABC transporter substrate-binding protein, partial [Thermoanaerobaculia bacterium]|nr:molybdate ABC transporter substrate-binding protein [Thermoanaerobaculia bacterium]